MQQIHQASSLGSAAEVAGWRERSVLTSEPEGRKLAALEPLRGEELPVLTIEEIIQKRGSTRRFSREPISLSQLSTILDRAGGNLRADFGSCSGHLNELYLIVNGVSGLDPGAYYYHWGNRSLERLQAGDFRDRAAYLGLEQALSGDAAVDIFFLADLKAIFQAYGNRGYRITQLEAGLLGGRMYLGAYAMGIGASGLTFYDDDVIHFFSPHARDKCAVFLMALGRSAPLRPPAP